MVGPSKLDIPLMEFLHLDLLRCWDFFHSESVLPLLGFPHSEDCV